MQVLSTCVGQLTTSCNTSYGLHIYMNMICICIYTHIFVCVIIYKSYMSFPYIYIYDLYNLYNDFFFPSRAPCSYTCTYPYIVTHKHIIKHKSKCFFFELCSSYQVVLFSEMCFQDLISISYPGTWE